MALLFALSSRPLPPVVADTPDWISHAAGYAVLAVLACRALAHGLGQPVTARAAVLAVIISVLYGVTDEFHQSFVPGRNADAWDVVKDLAGAVAGALASAWPRGSRAQRGKAA